MAGLGWLVIGSMHWVSALAKRGLGEAARLCVFVWFGWGDAGAVCQSIEWLGLRCDRGRKKGTQECVHAAAVVQWSVSSAIVCNIVVGPFDRSTRTLR